MNSSGLVFGFIDIKSLGRLGKGSISTGTDTGAPV